MTRLGSSSITRANILGSEMLKNRIREIIYWIGSAVVCRIVTCGAKSH